MPLFIFLAVLLFFPSVTFGIITAEIFPWAILFSGIFIRKLNLLTLLLLTALAASAFFSLAKLALVPSVTESDVLRSLFAYLNVILIYICFLQLTQEKLDLVIKISRTVFVSLIGLGLFQYSGAAAPLDSLFAALVPRASGTALLEMGGRGVTLLSSEPARAGIELSLLYVVFRMASGRSNSVSVFDVLMPVYIAIVIRSASAAAFCIFVVMMLTVRDKKNFFIWLPIIFLSPLAQIASYGGRAIDLVTAIMTYGSFSDILFFVANESGHRLLALYAFTVSGFVNPLGAGIGSWGYSSMDAIVNSGIDYTGFRYFQVWGGGQVVPVRAPGVLPNMMLDIGLVGTAFFVYWVLRSSAPFRSNRTDTIVIMTILFVKIILFGSLGNPIPWIVTALVLRWKPRREPANQTTANPLQPETPT